MLIASLRMLSERNMQVAVHLRTISSNKSHPSALLPLLVCGMKARFDGTSIQICDDIVAVVVRVHGVPRLMIWRWTTGQLLVVGTVMLIHRSLHLP